LDAPIWQLPFHEKTIAILSENSVVHRHLVCQFGCVLSCGLWAEVAACTLISLKNLQIKTPDLAIRR
jgi:hypothetical protein